MEAKDDFGIKDKIHLVLTGPDGKVKDERGGDDEASKEPEPTQPTRD